MIPDEEDPVITCPASFTVGTDDGLDNATVTFDPANVTDNSMLSITPVSYPVSGATFSIGDTEVQFNATDASGNTASCTFTVTVEGKSEMRTIPSILYLRILDGLKFDRNCPK